MTDSSAMGRAVPLSKLICGVVLLLMMTGFVGCGNQPAVETTDKASATPGQPEEQEAKVQPGAALTIEDDGRPVIVAFGDSLTAGYGVDREYSYPAYLQSLLDSHGYRYRVVNAGISGDTTAGGLTRTPNILEMKPAIVVLELGGNDGLRGLTLKQTEENLAKIITELQRARARVLLAGITLPRNYGPEYITGFEQIYRRLATKYKLPFLPFLLEGVALHAKSPDLMQADGIHARPAGNQIVAHNVFDVLKPLLTQNGN
ncbi:MAG: arylesterase [Bryobacterales bacterium]|nr:arylesterase [Bryobacterales bacterium]